MTDALARLRADVTREHVLAAIQEYDQLGPQRFFSKHGFGPSRTYELVWEERRYPHKAILGTATSSPRTTALVLVISRAARAARSRC
jgi:hypothetical protein